MLIETPYPRYYNDTDIMLPGDAINLHRTDIHRIISVGTNSAWDHTEWYIGELKDKFYDLLIEPYPYLKDYYGHPFSISAHMSGGITPTPLIEYKRLHWLVRRPYFTKTQRDIFVNELIQEATITQPYDMGAIIGIGLMVVYRLLTGEKFEQTPFDNPVNFYCSELGWEKAIKLFNIYFAPEGTLADIRRAPADISLAPNMKTVKICKYIKKLSALPA